MKRLLTVAAVVVGFIIFGLVTSKAKDERGTCSVSTSVGNGTVLKCGRRFWHSEQIRYVRWTGDPASVGQKADCTWKQQRFLFNAVAAYHKRPYHCTRRA